MKQTLFFNNAKLLAEHFTIVSLLYGSVGLAYVTKEALERGVLHQSPFYGTTYTLQYARKPFIRKEAILVIPKLKNILIYAGAVVIGVVVLALLYQILQYLFVGALLLLACLCPPWWR
ncbi:MAG: hypothetical protein IKU26_00470 [Clostridia bacterium]|nr:hypothetical protein [Clostridia bacterium]